MKNRYLFHLLLSIIWLMGHTARAQYTAQPTETIQPTDSIRPIVNHRIGFEVRPDYVLPTHRMLKSGEHKKMENKFYGIHLKYAFQYAADTYLGRLYPNTYQGIGISYNTFLNSSIGNPIALYVFQNSRIAQLSRRLSLNYEWNFGASFGWNPYNVATNPENEIVGSKINAYINLDFLLAWQVSEFWSLTGGIGFSHFSNGNTNYPNAGLNTAGIHLGAKHRFTTSLSRNAYRFNKGAEPLFAPHFSCDVVAYGATRKQVIVEEGYLIPGYFGIAGININPMYNFNKYLRAGISLDSQYDESANLKDNKAGLNEQGEIRFYRPSFREQFSVGLSLRAELVMPIFSINFGIGHNVLYRGSDLKGLYQIVALKTHITRDFYLHTGYQLSKFHTPKNLMLGIGYRFH